jgi:putative transposase
VHRLQARFGVSERRACAAAGQHRSTQRHHRSLVPDEEHLRRRLHELARRNRRLGYRKQHVILRREGWTVNRKRVRRIWRQEGLQVPARKKRRRRGRRAPGHVAPSRPNQVWAMDFQFDDITRGRRIKILNVTDEFTREALAGHVARHITAKDTVGVLQEIVGERGAPTHIRCDNGPEFIAKVLARWCSRRGSRTAHIEPGAPWQNPFVESYNGHLRKELLDLELLDSVLEAQVLIDDWREEYNTYRPHQSLRYLTPVEFARRWRMENEGRVSQQVDR